MGPRPVFDVDLHVHSTESDGSLTPEQLASHAAGLGMRAIALADHDSVAGVVRCVAACEARGVLCLPAVELSSRDGDTHVHVLGYFVDVDDPALAVLLAHYREQRAARIMAMARRLADAGLVVDLAPLEAQAASRSLGRVHLGNALVAAGLASDLPDAFARFIGKDKPYYIAGERPSPSDAVAVLLDAGAVPVMAHPAVSGAERLIEQLASEGLAGIEVYHGDHEPEQRERLAATAKRLGLLATGGSDFHGPGVHSGEMGSSDVPPGVLEALLEAGGR